MAPIIIESWLHDAIRKQLREDTEFRRWMGKETLPQITRPDIERYHVFMFRKAIAYASQKSVFYRDLLKKTGMKAEDINSPADISRIPLTTPEDIAQYPYLFACIPLGDISSITTFASSGTTGPQKKVFVSENDLGRMTDFMATGMREVAKEGDIVQIMLPSRRPNDQASLLAIGVRKMGGIPAVTGNALSPDEQIKKICENHPAVLFAETAYMWRVTQETCHAHDLKTKGVKTIFLTAEHCSDSMRKQLEKTWACEVEVHYGMTEMGLGVSIECEAHNGYHYNEADLMAEIVDPETGEALQDDEEGEVVFTTLKREAMPLIRYRTHDISRFMGMACKCGASTLKKIAPVTRRREAIVKINSDELYPSIFDELLFQIPEIIDYQAVFTKNGCKNILTLKIEAYKQGEEIQQAVKEKLLSDKVIRKNTETGVLELPPIQSVKQGSLGRVERAKKLITDERATR
ncbi:MAG TPA: AMP-binding protein [Dehalococcoidales bacterium]|nr:AMP-binding protein [Dehalococcoidales bacterium]